MSMSIQGIPTAEAERLRAGGPDANGQPALLRQAQGPANPCRHCLQLIAEGEEMLVLAWRPFERAQPYAEVGPIFLHRRECERYAGPRLPAWFKYLDPALVRGYDARDWIDYDTGAVVAGRELAEACEGILARPGIAYVHIRSKYNCFQCRVERADQASSISP